MSKPLPINVIPIWNPDWLSRHKYKHYILGQWDDLTFNLLNTERNIKHTGFPSGMHSDHRVQLFKYYFYALDLITAIYLRIYIKRKKKNHQTKSKEKTKTKIEENQTKSKS